MNFFSYILSIVQGIPALNAVGFNSHNYHLVVTVRDLKVHDPKSSVRFLKD